MAGKIILITGTSTGLGAAIAIQAARRANTVYATMRDLKKMEPVAQAAANAGAKLNFLSLDVRDNKSVVTAVAEIMRREGRIDVLVNNAGSGYARPTEQASFDDIDWIMDVNFMGAVRTAKAVIPHMRTARAGHIVNISSVGGLVGQPFNEIYCASKFALEGYTESLASYMPLLGLKFTAVEPGGIKSEFFASAMKRTMETGGMPQDPDYYPILQKYLAKSRERGTTAYQTAEEVAEVVIKCIESRDPPVRIRTSPWSNDLCHLKTASDPDGKKLQKKVVEMFLGK
jgi:NAD(P)-dependent dehydrogenase (short-subunit alcohol dehydrogenase family)